MTPNETARVVAVLSAAFPNQALPEATLTVWADTLGDIPADQAQAAARQIVASEQWFPTIAKFREVWVEQRRRARLEDQPALPSGERPLSKARLAELRATLANIGRKP